jgi:hypothetical protein
LPRRLKAALNVFVVEGQILDDPRDLTEETTAQSGFYTHRGLDDQASSIRPGVLTPDTLPGRVLESVDGPRGSAEEFDKVFLKTCKVDLLFTLIRGSTLIYASLVNDPHENGAT